MREIHKVDIAICTWNRSQLLADTLKSFSALNIDDAISLRILIVDNNSSDLTPDVIRSFCKSDFATRHTVVPLRETRQGHTYSRNCAINAADSDLIIWTDDDVNVESDWVQKYVQAANAFPDITFFGGVIKPRFKTKMPRWISENWESLKGCFAVREFAGELALNQSRLPYGANFAIRTELQKQFQFDHRLGRRGEEVLGEDELDLFRRLLAAAYRGQWVPGAALWHVIPEDRATEKYVFDYFVGQGRALVAKGEQWHSDIDLLNKESRSEYRKYKLRRWYRGTRVWVSHMLRSGLAQGQAEAMTQ
ncbi:MAG: glycosyltransferase [Mariniblastus sp.]|nr:glycosyltransferase [Mariniblastus sp.]